MNYQLMNMNAKHHAVNTVDVVLRGNVSSSVVSSVVVIILPFVP